MHTTLEHQEHADHAAEHGNKRAALLIAVLAALLAICEQQAKRADIAVEENAILAADSWAEYQAKSIRAAMARDLERLGTSLDTPAAPDRASLRAEVLKQLESDRAHYEHDPQTGKEAIATRARGYETVRQESLERAHTFDNSAAALELGIVLATASVITSSKLLIRFAVVMGVIGVVLGVMAVIRPELVVF
jgi:hypothetical protein